MRSIIIVIVMINSLIGQLKYIGSPWYSKIGILNIAISSKINGMIESSTLIFLMIIAFLILINKYKSITLKGVVRMVFVI